ncbi:hypothetical protein [Streptomyces atratus]
MFVSLVAPSEDGRFPDTISGKNASTPAGQGRIAASDAPDVQRS